MADSGSHTRRRVLEALGGSWVALSGCVGQDPAETQTTAMQPSTAAMGSPTSTTREEQPRRTLGATQTIHVSSAEGSIEADGTPADPLLTIQGAIDRAVPGQTIQVAPGEYRETIETRTSGTADSPITITGPPDAVLRANPAEGGNNVVRIQHNFINLQGLTITALVDPERPDDLRAYADMGLVQTHPGVETDEYLHDLVIAPARIGFSNGGGVNLTRTKNVEVGPIQIIGPMGAPFTVGNEVGNNGEIVYVGTHPGHAGSDWYPWKEVDRTRNVHIHHLDNSAGHPHSELVNTKPGTRNVLVEYCTDGGGSMNRRDWPTASVRFLSYDATVRWCDLANGEGIGVEISNPGDHLADRDVYQNAQFDRFGTENAIYGNRIRNFMVALRFSKELAADDQRIVCGNEIRGPEDMGAVMGDSAFTPGQKCPTTVQTGDGVGHTGGNSPWE